MTLILRFSTFFIPGLLGACSGSSDTTTNEATYSIELAFSRIDNAAGLDPFSVTATLLKDGSPTAGLTPTVRLQRGSHNGISDLGNGNYRFTVTPTQTGEHKVTVSYENASLSRTALVFTLVHAVTGDSRWRSPDR